jgi:hypothetical protein
MLLIFPPVAKPGELPAGVTRLAAALKAHELPCHLLDANLEGLLWLMHQPKTKSDAWTRRATKHVDANLAALRSPVTYASPARYRRAVTDLQRALATAGNFPDVAVGLADFQHQRLSPIRSNDLLFAAEHPEQNPFYAWYSVRLPELLANETSPFIGVSLNFLSQAITTFSMIGFLRREFPQCKIALGGGLVTSWVKRPGWRNPFGGLVDHLIAGPGELPLLRLHGIDTVKGCPREPELGELVLNQYLSPKFILPYSASTGCFWNRCSFCPETAEAQPYVPIPPMQALSELNSLVRSTQPGLVHLLDNAISPAFMEACIQTPPGAPWYGFARIGTQMADPDFCNALKRSGCVLLQLGVESGSQRVLDSMHKGLDLGLASQALRNLKRAGIAAYVYLLFGTPAETLDEARKTLEFTVQHSDSITFLNLAVFNMPLTDSVSTACEPEPFSDGDLSLYTGFRHPGGWDRKSVRRFLETEFRRVSQIAAILQRDPPIFTSNHAAFFAAS